MSSCGRRATKELAQRLVDGSSVTWRSPDGPHGAVADAAGPGIFRWPPDPAARCSA